MVNHTTLCGMPCYTNAKRTISTKKHWMSATSTIQIVHVRGQSLATRAWTATQRLATMVAATWWHADRAGSTTDCSKSYGMLTHEIMDNIPPWIALRPKCRSYTVENEVNWSHRLPVTQTQSEKTYNKACLESRSMQQKERAAEVGHWFHLLRTLLHAQGMERKGRM